MGDGNGCWAGLGRAGLGLAGRSILNRAGFLLGSPVHQVAGHLGEGAPLGRDDGVERLVVGKAGQGFEVGQGAGGEQGLAQRGQVLLAQGHRLISTIGCRRCGLRHGWLRVEQTAWPGV